MIWLGLNYKELNNPYLYCVEVKIIFDLYISRLLFNILEEDYLSSYFFRISAIIKAKKSS